MQREASEPPKQTISDQLKKKGLWRKFKEQFRQEMREKHGKKPTPEKK